MNPRTTEANPESPSETLQDADALKQPDPGSAGQAARRLAGRKEPCADAAMSAGRSASRGEDLDGRVVLHVDVDGFYCACEARRRPELRGKPVAVTQFNSGGFVALNGEASRAGLRKGDGIGAQGHRNLRFFKDRPDATMEGVMRKCPDLTILPMDTDWYRTCSEDLLDALASFRSTLVVEKSSIDDFFIEATAHVDLYCDDNHSWDTRLVYLWAPGDQTADQRNAAANMSPRAAAACSLAADLRAHVRETLGGMTISVGIGPNKLLARLVSKRKLTPDSQTIIFASMATDLAQSTALKSVPGLKGKLGSQIQEAFGVEKLADLNKIPDADLARSVPGKVAWLRDLAHCRDDSQVIVRGPRKSIMTERSFVPTSLRSAACQEVIRMLCKDITRRLLDERDRRKRAPNALTVLWRIGYGSQTLESRRLSPFPCPLDQSESGVSRLARIVASQLPASASSLTRIALNATAFEDVQGRSLVAMFRASSKATFSSAPLASFSSSSSTSTSRPSLKSPQPRSLNSSSTLPSEAVSSAKNSTQRPAKRQRTLDSFVYRSSMASSKALKKTKDSSVIDLVDEDSSDNDAVAIL